MRTRPFSLISAVTAALLSGTASLSAAVVQPAVVVQSQPDPVAIYVQNQTGHSLNVAVERGAARIVLGRVQQGERRRFEVSAGQLAASNLRLVATRSGMHTRLESEAFMSTGDDIAWHLNAAPFPRNGIGWGMLTNSPPRDAHTYSRRG